MSTTSSEIKFKIVNDSVGGHQCGYQCTARIKKGEIIISLHGCEELTQPDRYTVQIAEHIHLHQSPDLAVAQGGHSCAYLNHSCDPNTYIDTERREVVALKDIEPGEELTFNYLSTEYDMASPFDCLCKSPKCFGTIRGFKHIADPEDRKRISCVAPWMQKKIEALEA
eukprot:GEZU01031135.1.p2 GENE.GEZU01031135.1~~GEZU01031135.1.p2  ORF type:complete len:168 (+),score=43.96 GEZU01031135.1:69-572(+)